MAETIATPVKAPKVGDAVHFVAHGGKPGARFAKVHLDAKVTKVHGKDGKVVDLDIEGDDATYPVTRSPRDDSAQAADSWHLPEVETKPAA